MAYVLWPHQNITPRFCASHGNPAHPLKLPLPMAKLTGVTALDPPLCSAQHRERGTPSNHRDPAVSWLRHTRDGPGLGTRCPGWPQGGSGHLCPQDHPAGLGASEQRCGHCGTPGQRGCPGAGEGPQGWGLRPSWLKDCGLRERGAVVTVGRGTQPVGEGLWTLWLSDHGPHGRRGVITTGGGTRCPWMRGCALVVEEPFPFLGKGL